LKSYYVKTFYEKILIEGFKMSEKKSFWRRAAESVSDAAKSAADTTVNTVKEGAGYVSGAGTYIIDGTTARFNAVVGAIDGSVRASIEATNGLVGAGVKAVDDSVQGTRNLAADVISGGGKVIGHGGGLAGEVTLIVATAPMMCIPYLFIGGSAAELGAKFADSTSEFSKHIRGSRPQFIGIHKDEYLFSDELKAIIYLPQSHNANKDGLEFVSETQLDARRKTADVNKQALYDTAMFALQDAKLSSGMALDCPKLIQNARKPFAGMPKVKK
jgi:hypothetical protein